MRSYQELASVSDPAWPTVHGWLKQATNRLRVLAVDPDSRGPALCEVGVTLKSALGAMIHETGGILVDDGWLRLRGSGHLDLPRRVTCDGPNIIVADDVVGGFFALLPPKGQVSYLAPDTLVWFSMDLGYSDWLRWCFSGDLTKFYADYRGRDWRERTKSLRPDRAFSIYPPPFAAGPAIPERSWSPVPVEELYAFLLDMRHQCDKLGVGPGDAFRIQVEGKAPKGGGPAIP